MGSFYEKELQKTNQKEFRIGKILKTKGNKYFIPYRNSERNIKVKLDLSSYATKPDLKNVTHVDVSSFALKTNLANLKTEVYKIDIAK